MGKWVRDIGPDDFLKWAKENPLQFDDFWYESGLLTLVEELEQQDFFGTEGFDKRFG